jgi:FkbM family methyltransferase
MLRPRSLGGSILAIRSVSGSLVAMFDSFRSHGLTVENIGRVVRNTDGARVEALRACIFLLARQLTPFIGVEHDGVRYVLSPRESTGVCFPTFVRGFFDEQTVRNMTAALAQHAGIATVEGLTVLEVGANIGTETVSFLLHHGIKRVVAMEPDAENVRFLRANLALNGVQDRVTIHEMALSNADGMVVLERSEDNWGDHRVRIAESFGPDHHDEGLRTTSEVPARRLDSLVDAGEIDLDEIDLVWVDAQGHEGHILDGAERIAAAGIPIVAEYWPYGLRRVGALDRFHALIAKRYHVVVDLREPAVALAAEHVAALADRYTANNAADRTVLYTDLLLLPR